MLGKLNNTEIEEVLTGQILGRIGCHAHDRTYIVPVSYAYDGRYVYVYSKNGMKVDIMRKSPDICFEVECLQDMANWKTVIAWGTFEEIIDISKRKAALKKLLHRRLPIVSSETTHLSEHWPFEPTDISTIEGIVFRLDLRDKTGRFENIEKIEAISKSFL
jgi:nitroimidazol reductase NimA-like FMN-containing flavoprotein (pyridoxamine 5'-phosphate oxidase superfamily)